MSVYSTPVHQPTSLHCQWVNKDGRYFQLMWKTIAETVMLAMNVITRSPAPALHCIVHFRFQFDHLVNISLRHRERFCSSFLSVIFLSTTTNLNCRRIFKVEMCTVQRLPLINYLGFQLTLDIFIYIIYILHHINICPQELFKRHKKIEFSPPS